MHDDGVPTGCGFRLDPLLGTSAKNQQAAFSPSVLNCCSHERADQFLQDDFARHCLRDLDNGSQIQVFNRCPDCARRTRYGLVFPEPRIQLVELPHFPSGSPAEVAETSFPQIRVSDQIETTRYIEARCQLAGKRLIVDEAVSV